MRVPQEIVDTIIDNVGLTKEDHDTLKACALTCRSFVQKSRVHLFFAISLYPTEDDSEKGRLFKFDKLLAESPHIGSLYVRSFALMEVNDESPYILEDSLLVSRILPLLPNLLHLKVDVDCSQWWETQPPLLQTALRAAFSLDSLRIVELSQYTFADALELEALLADATGLKELALRYIRFGAPSNRSASSSSCGAPSVVLQSLNMDAIPMQEVSAMLEAFSTVDIRHLRSLSVHNGTPIIPLFKENAQSLQKFRCSFPNAEQVDPDISGDNTGLRTIELEQPIAEMASTLQLFGSLKALKTVKLHFSDLYFDGSSIADESWKDLDTILGQTGDNLEEVHISANTETGSPPDLGNVQLRLPSVSGKIRVHAIKWK